MPERFWYAIASRPIWMVPGTTSGCAARFAAVCWSAADGAMPPASAELSAAGRLLALTCVCWKSASLGGLMPAILIAGVLLLVVPPIVARKNRSPGAVNEMAVLVL